MSESRPKFELASSEQDLQQVEQLAGEIWRSHYTPIIGARQVEYMLNRFQSVPAMRQQITEGYCYYRILLDGELAGYFSVLPEPEEQRLILSKIYVHSEFRGRGLGASAMQAIEGLARDAGLASIDLTVNKHNSGSIAAYGRMGFANVGDTVIDIGGGFIMDDYAMRKVLS